MDPQRRPAVSVGQSVEGGNEALAPKHRHGYRGQEGGASRPHNHGQQTDSQPKRIVPSAQPGDQANDSELPAEPARADDQHEHPEFASQRHPIVEPGSQAPQLNLAVGAIPALGPQHQWQRRWLPANERVYQYRQP